LNSFSPSALLCVLSHLLFVPGCTLYGWIRLISADFARAAQFDFAELTAALPP